MKFIVYNELLSGLSGVTHLIVTHKINGSPLLDIIMKLHKKGK